MTVSTTGVGAVIIARGAVVRVMPVVVFVGYRRKHRHFLSGVEAWAA